MNVRGSRNIIYSAPPEAHSLDQTKVEWHMATLAVKNGHQTYMLDDLILCSKYRYHSRFTF